ncbi:MAG: hypothetical protein AAF740_05660 [Bacteroidota bacterium]
MGVYPHPHQKDENETLSNLRMSLSEVLNAKEGFDSEDEQKAVALLNRVQLLLEDKELHKEAWHEVDDEAKYFAKRMLGGGLLQELGGEGFNEMMKEVFSKTVEMTEGLDESFKTLAFDMLDGKDVELPKYTFENERQYYEKLYGARMGVLSYLSMSKAKRDMDAEKEE